MCVDVDVDLGCVDEDDWDLCSVPNRLVRPSWREDETDRQCYSVLFPLCRQPKAE